jgi:hypothetical protein
MERAARMQVLSESIGTIKPIDPAMAHEAHDYRLKSRAVAATFHYFARRVLKHAAGLASGRGLLLLFSFSDAGPSRIIPRARGRRPKSFKGRNRGRNGAIAPVVDARAMGISPRAQT